MNFALYAKAWIALVMALLTAFVQFTPLASDGTNGIVAVIGAFVTALSVYFVSNRANGLNVTDVARSVIDAGLDLVGKESKR